MVHQQPVAFLLYSELDHPFQHTWTPPTHPRLQRSFQRSPRAFPAPSLPPGVIWVHSLRCGLEMPLPGMAAAAPMCPSVPAAPAGQTRPWQPQPPAQLLPGAASAASRVSGMI